MKVLFLCGVFAKENEKEILCSAKRPIEYSANVFQEKLINGFNMCDCEFSVISAPFIGSYPNASLIREFKGFSEKQDQYDYVNFNNIWGIRNLSRAKALKKAVRSFASKRGDDKIIVVYSPHTPFVEAAVYAKKLDPSIKICLVVPDLPQYMNLNSKVSRLYKIGKKYDIKKFSRLNEFVDSYILLTDYMKEKLDVKDKPYQVVEGIIDVGVEFSQTERQLNRHGIKYVLYAGKLNEKFGVKNLIDAFSFIDSPEYRLVLCGSGDVEKYARNKCLEDNRIICLGQVTPDVVQEWIHKASVLVNPRQNNEVYTRYSFPSKNIEYLLSGIPVVAYMLDGMPKKYENMLYSVPSDDIQALADTIVLCGNITSKDHRKKQQTIVEYFNNLRSETVCAKLIEMTMGDK